jgi:hypothetical protein
MSVLTLACPGGDAKQHKDENIDIRRYPETKSITLSRKLKDEIKEKFISMASISRESANTEKENEVSDVHNEEKRNHYVSDNRKLSLETFNGHLEALAKEVNANTTAVNNMY